MLNHELVTTGSLVSQVRKVTEVLLDYFEKETISKIHLSKLQTIYDKLDELFNRLMNHADQDLDEATIEKLCEEGLTTWQKITDELLKLVAEIIETTPLDYATNIQDLYERLKLFCE